MERNFYTDEFEQLLKEKADQFRMYPSKRVWHSIYNNLHPSRRWPSAVMSILLFFSLVFTGYLNTSDNNVIKQFAGNSGGLNTSNQTTQPHKNIAANNKRQQLPNTSPINDDAKSFDEPGILVYTDSKTGNPNASGLAGKTSIGDGKLPAVGKTTAVTGDDLIQSVDTYIKTNQVFADAAKSNKRIKVTTSSSSANAADQEEVVDENVPDRNNSNQEVAVIKKDITGPENSLPVDKPTTASNENEKKDIKKADSKQITPEEKAWIEDYVLQNKSERSKWKDRLAISFYATPAVNYRKLSTNSKGLATSITPFANSDINNSISQRPGFGFETGVGLSYSFAKNLRLKGGVQFNYTNYNINADQTNHPILTSILLNDPYTGYSYSAFRTSTISNSYNSSALQPVILHNRTYQISVPLGLAYKLSGKNNVEWLFGASVQPTYIFGGKANLISSDLKSYVSEPSSIRNWNINFGFETYMSYKLGTYNLQVGPQVRYQIFSTYRKDVALIEKPYALGLKIGLVKGF